MEISSKELKDGLRTLCSLVNRDGACHWKEAYQLAIQQRNIAQREVDRLEAELEKLRKETK